MNGGRIKERMRMILALSLVCISLFGCRSSHGNEAREIPADTSKPDITQGEKPGGTEIRYHCGIQADKKLVWVCDYSFLVNVEDELLDEFNRLLVEEYECDFTVDFIGINSRDYISYQAELRNKMKNKEQADILYTGLGREDKADTYTQAIKDALILPLTELLRNTEYGKELYQAFDGKFWESMKYNGIIYGLRPLEEIALRNCILANNKYYQGEAIAGQVTFDDLGDILKKAYESSGVPDTVLPLYVSSNALCSLEGYMQVSWGHDGIYYKRTNGSWQIVNGADEDRIQELWRKIREYNTLGNYEGGDPSEKLRGGQFYAAIRACRLASLYDGRMELYDSLYEVTELNAVGGYVIYPQNAVTGIASWSEYPEDAIRLISLIETKAELSNLLAYGIEGKHYVIENNKLIKLSYEGRVPGSASLANRMITFCEGLEPVDKTDIYKERNAEAVLSPQVIYQLDYGDYEDRILEVSRIYAEYSGLWNGEYTDVDAAVKALQDRLKEAGIDGLIKKLNELLPE